MVGVCRLNTRFKKLIGANYQQIIFVFLAFLAMVLVSYFYVSSIVNEQMFFLGEETMNTIQTAVSASLSEAELSFGNMARALETMLGTKRSNREILEFLVQTNRYFGDKHSPLPDFMKVYGYIGDEFLDGSGWVPPAGYIPTTRPWYIGAVAHKNTIFFSEPYIDAETGGMCISFSKELFDPQGASHGVVAIDLKLNRIVDYVAKQKIANNGYGVLLSDTLRFTSHRNPALLETEMASAGTGYAHLAALIENGKPIAAERFIDSDGTDSVAFFRTIFNGWHIGAVIPRASYYAQVYRLAAVLGILGFALMTALCYILVRTNAEKMRSDEESKSKTSFLAHMSHEMRTPMNAIIGMTGIARRTGDTERIQYCLRKIDDAATHLLGVINDILDMSKIEAGKFELSETDFPFQEMVDQATTVAGFKIEEKKQHLAIRIDDGVPPSIIADRQRLAQVIANLLNNANKFTPEDGNITLRVSAEGAPEDRRTLRIEVADNGIGISPEQRERLFQSFEQADDSISRKYGGTGLGLAISKTIVERMDGKIWVESELGKGARFIFTARVGVGNPEKEIGATPGTPREGTCDTAFAGKHILLAEDVEINREILAAMFDGTGVEIDCAENGRLAVERFIANAERYDMIFMDIHMPEMDGYEATRQIRAQREAIPRAETIPIVAMTANVFKEDIAACLAAGMNDHIGKPIEIDELMAKTRRYLCGGVETTAAP